ncbi:Mpv17/PMP22 family protein [Xylaria sp. CBS 124048]|nr:Mpv17/PMP22 family protein [Xylaria sp. CBS 124048]
MALPPIVSATLQSAVLTATSNTLAQCLTAYKSDKHFVLDLVPIFQFVLFAFLNVPPNFLWQEFLESTFPAHAPSSSSSSSSSSSAATNDEKKANKAAKDGKPAPQPKLNIPNTIIKFLLDQSLGAAANTFLFSLFIHSIQDAMPRAPGHPLSSPEKSLQYLLSASVINLGRVNWDRVVAVSQREFFPIMSAGWRVWPFVSLINFAFVKSVQGRNLVASCAGLGWGIYMSLLAARR